MAGEKETIKTPGEHALMDGSYGRLRSPDLVSSGPSCGSFPISNFGQSEIWH
jgi:hypothetical protein